MHSFYSPFYSHFNFLLLLPFLLLSSSLSAQPLGRYRADFQTSATDFSDTIDIEWDYQQVYVPVTIEGKDYRFLLDTGASQTVVFSDSPLAEGSRLGNIISHDANGRSDTVPMVSLPPVQLGSLTLTGMQATVHPRSSRVDGILGFDLVNGGLTMTIDVPHRRLILTDRRISAKDYKKASVIYQKYSLNYHVPYISLVPFGRHRERVLVDTGSRQFFAMNKRHFDEAHEKEETILRAQLIPDYIIEGRSIGRYAIGHYGVEPLGEVAFLQLNNLRLDKLSFTDVHCLTTQGGSHLGAPILEYGSVTFIPRKRHFVFQPVPHTPSPLPLEGESSQTPPQQELYIPLPHREGQGEGLDSLCIANRQLEIAFVADSLGRPQVGLVWEQGIPYQQGFRQGDIIQEIDHVPVQSLPQFVRWPFLRGREYLFTLCSSEGQQREVGWVRLP